MAGILVGLILVLLCGPLLVLASGTIDLSARWSSASRAPAGLAPDPAETPEAVVQVYGARAFSWRGAFAVHTWIAVKWRLLRQFSGAWMVLSVQILEPFPGHVGVNLGGGQVAVAEQHLNHAQIRAVVDQVSGEGVP